MTTIIVRVLIIYILILIVFRIMGKRQIAQMQPFEFVLTLIIADLATIPMAEIALPLLNGIVPLLTLVVFQFIITILTKKFTLFSRLVSGKPVIIVNPNGIDYKALRKLNITLDDLFESIRVAGYFSLSDIEYAIMETNGEVSIMPKSQVSPATKGDFNIEPQNGEIPLSIISEGKFLTDNLKLSSHDKEYYLNFLQNQNIKSIKSVLLLTITKGNEIYLQEKYKSCKIINKN